jgi:hypothetical protein
MKCTVRRRNDGTWEAGPHSAPALLTFDSEAALIAFAKSIEKLDPDLAVDINGAIGEQRPALTRHTAE